MKRMMSEFENDVENKKMCFGDIKKENPTQLPLDIWADVCNYLDRKSMASLSSTSNFFAISPRMKEILYRKEIQIYFDYRDDKELSSSLSSFDPKLEKFKKYQKLLTFLHQEYEKSINPFYELQDELIPQLFNLIEKGYIRALQFVLDANPDWDINQKFCESTNMTVLGYAALTGRKRIFDFLLQKKATYIIGNILPNNDEHLIDFDIAGDGTVQAFTPLHIIAFTDELWLKELLTQFSDSLESIFSAKYYQFLQLIILNDAEELASLLKEDNSILDEFDAAKWHLLHWAACLDKPNCINVLIAFGENVNAEGGFLAPLIPFQLACAKGNLSAIKTLADSGANIDIVDIAKNTCLHLTASNGFIDCTEYLIKELKFDVNAINDYDETPLDVVQSENEELIKILKETEASEKSSQLLR